jgi:hypothetical protein
MPPQQQETLAHGLGEIAQFGTHPNLLDVECPGDD